MTSRLFGWVFLGSVVPALALASRPWQQVDFPTAAEVADGFRAPPPEYGAQFTWGWRGPVNEASIVRDLDGMKALGVSAAIIDPASRLKERYLSDGYFRLVKVAVEEAKKRGMRLWIMDDGDYPSGMAGGKITTDRPDLRMQALLPAERVAVAAGQTFEREVGPGVISIVAHDRREGTVIPLKPVAGRVSWTAPKGDWEVLVARGGFRTSPTRAAYNPTGAKDTTYSLIDYLNPAATDVFLDWTFGGYERVLGDELGKTVLGFRGDEPAYVFNPWTPRLPEEFLRRKGYDVRPYLPFFGGRPAQRDPNLTREQRLAYADYCDVWSDLFEENYFDREAAWCAAHAVEMQLHIEHEDMLPQLATADGDYFKAFRRVQVPGIDTIWHQIWMDNPADFPKLASSAAHLFGHPRAMCEAFAAYRPPPNLRQARWILDFLLVHGVNRIEYMFYPSSAARGLPPPPPPPGAAPKPAYLGRRRAPYYRDPAFPETAACVNRLSYVLGEGRPAADIALYLPSISFWVGDPAATERVNGEVLAIARQLIAAHRDFDFLDDVAFEGALRLRGDRLVNLSGQGYRAVIVPPCLAIRRRTLEGLKAFAGAGGRVIVLGEPPKLVVDRSFLRARGPAEVGWATLRQPEAAVTQEVLASLPAPDLTTDEAAPLVSYEHRRLRDAEVYFLFNSGDAETRLKVTMLGRGPAEIWNADAGKIIPADGATAADGRHLRIALTLPAWGVRLLVLRRPGQRD